jgi:hypothetical protein
LIISPTSLFRRLSAPPFFLSRTTDKNLPILLPSSSFPGSANLGAYFPHLPPRPSITLLSLLFSFLASFLSFNSRQQIKPRLSLIYRFHLTSPKPPIPILIPIIQKPARNGGECVVNTPHNSCGIFAALLWFFVHDFQFFLILIEVYFLPHRAQYGRLPGGVIRTDKTLLFLGHVLLSLFGEKQNFSLATSSCGR